MTTPGPRIRTPAGSAPVVPVILLGIGGYLAWFGIHYWKSDVKWPTTPVKDILQGKGLPDATVSTSAEEAAVEQLASATATTPATTVTVGGGSTGLPQGTAGITSTGAHNQQIGKMLATSYGWGSGTQWDDLIKLWNKESGWSNTADTRKTGLDPPNAAVFAYGIAQARPYTKYPKAGWPPDKGGKADPATQITWGLAYIKGRYGSPSAAWAHEGAYKWY